MAAGARVTDEVNYWRRRGELRNAVRVMRRRAPERLRWRAALGALSAETGNLAGLSRARVEEPVREIVLDLDDRILRREAVLDARKVGVDLDRGEVLPVRTRWDLKRTAFLTGVDHELLGRYLRLPTDFERAVDTAGVVVVARAISLAHKQRAQKLMAAIGDPVRADLRRHERMIAERAQYERDLASRWAALSKTMLNGSK